MKTSIYGTPMFDEYERALLRAVLLSKPCKVCDAKMGEACVVGRWENGKTHFKDRSRKMESGCHMGRLPDGFDSVVAVEEAKKKLAS